MRFSVLLAVSGIMSLVSCSGPREWALPYDGAIPRPGGRTDGAVPVGGLDGPSTTTVEIDGGAAGGGGVGGNQPVDAQQPVGGCDPATTPKVCVGDVLNICEAGGALVGTNCAHGCNAVRVECNQCRPNTRTCSGTNLSVCKPDGSGADPMTCPSGCNAAAGECQDCQPGTVWCAGDILRECTTNGEPRDRQPCPQGCNAAKLACDVCRPGTKSCTGNILETCKADGSGTVTEACASGCNPARLACDVCEPGTTTCSGATLRTCKTDGSGFTDQACANGCSTNRCNVCNPAQGRTCEGSSAKECLSDGSGFRTDACGRGCAAGACCGGNTEARGGSCASLRREQPILLRPRLARMQRQPGLLECSVRDALWTTRRAVPGRLQSSAGWGLQEGGRGQLHFGRGVPFGLLCSRREVLQPGMHGCMSGVWNGYVPSENLPPESDVQERPVHRPMCSPHPYVR